MNKELIYVYGISSTAPQLEKIKGTDELRVFSTNTNYAITKVVSEAEYSEENLKKHFSDLHWIETQARMHVQVISHIMETNTIVPCKFGTIFTCEESLQEFLENFSNSLQQNLQVVEGKEEWSVKMYCNTNIVGEQIAELSDAVRAMELQIRESSPGKSFLLQKKRKDLVQEEVERISNSKGQLCYEKLKRLSQLNSLNKLLPKDLTGKEADMILNATFLVEKARVNEFINLVKSLNDANQALGFELECSGPWPPFSFISIQTKDAGVCN